MMSLALQGVGLMAEYCAQCAKQYGMSNGFINECKPNYLANVICEGCGLANQKIKNHSIEWFNACIWMPSYI